MTLNYRQELASLLNLRNTLSNQIGTEDLLPKLIDHIKKQYRPKDAIELLALINQKLQFFKDSDDQQQQINLTSLLSSIVHLFNSDWNNAISSFTNINEFVNYFTKNNFDNNIENTKRFLQLSSIDNLLKLGKNDISAIIQNLNNNKDSLNNLEFGKIFELEKHVEMLTRIEQIRNYNDLLSIIKDDKKGVFLDTLLSDKNLLSKCGLVTKNTSNQWAKIRTAIYQNLEQAIKEQNKFAAGRIAQAFKIHFHNPLHKTVDETPFIRYFKARKSDQSSKIDALSNENTHVELGPRTLVPHVLPQPISAQINKNQTLVNRLEELNNKLKNKKYHTLWDLIYEGLKLKIKNNQPVDNLNILNISLQALHEVIKENGEPKNIGDLDFVVYQDQIDNYIQAVSKDLKDCGIVKNDAKIKVEHKFISTYDHNIINPKTGKPHSTDYQKEIINAANKTSKYDVVKIECHSGIERSASFINNMIMIKTTTDCTDVSDFQTPFEICQATHDNRPAAKELPKMANEQIQFTYSMQADVINHPDIINNPNLLDNKNTIINTKAANDKKELLLQAFAKKNSEVIAQNANLYFGTKPSIGNSPFDNILIEVFKRNLPRIDIICNKMDKANKAAIKKYQKSVEKYLSIPNILSTAIDAILFVPRILWLIPNELFRDGLIDDPKGIVSGINALPQIVNEKIEEYFNKKSFNCTRALNAQKEFQQRFLPNLFFDIINNEEKRAAFINEASAESIAKLINAVFASQDKKVKDQLANNGAKIIEFMQQLHEKTKPDSIIFSKPEYSEMTKRLEGDGIYLNHSQAVITVEKDFRTTEENKYASVMSKLNSKAKEEIEYLTISCEIDKLAAEEEKTKSSINSLLKTNTDDQQALQQVGNEITIIKEEIDQSKKEIEKKEKELKKTEENIKNKIKIIHDLIAKNPKLKRKITNYEQQQNKASNGYFNLNLFKKNTPCSFAERYLKEKCQTPILVS